MPSLCLRTQQMRKEHCNKEVILRVDYYYVLYMGLPLEMIQKLHLVECVAVHLLSDSAHWDYVTLVLKSLQWVSVCFQVQFKVMGLAFKALHDLRPTY